ncbi:MAG: nitrilase-related carbon-nitrogen hydrolase, partial [bacterium]
MKQYTGYFRVAAGIPTCSVADVMANATNIAEVWQQAEKDGVSLIVFPELCLTGYTARDLFMDRALINETYKALEALVKISQSVDCAAIVGLPIEVEDMLMNCAAFIQKGKLLGLVPKSYLPNYREFEETRWFHSGRDLSVPKWFGPIRAPIGTDLLFSSNDGAIVGVEICEDMWVQVPPSSYQVSAGANIVCNLSASNFTIGKAELRRLLAGSISDRGKCAYVYVAAGPGESSTDLAFDADAFVYENGNYLVESQRFLRGNQLIYTDIDIGMLSRERLATGTFGDCSVHNKKTFRYIPFRARKVVGKLARKIEKHPFIPNDPETLSERCWETFEIQSNALATRLQATG